MQSLTYSFRIAHLSLTISVKFPQMRVNFNTLNNFLPRLSEIEKKNIFIIHWLTNFKSLTMKQQCVHYLLSAY